MATIYRCRWAAELLFRDLKTLYELNAFDTNNPSVVEILLYVAVLTLLVSCELLELVVEHAGDDAVFPPERWAATFRLHAQQILKRLSDYLSYSPPPAVRVDGSRRTEDPSVTSSPTGTVRYRRSTNCWS